MMTLLITILIILAVAYIVFVKDQKGGGTKCFSCEAQDQRLLGYIRPHGSKCFSCERQDKFRLGRIRHHGTKCFSCEQ